MAGSADVFLGGASLGLLAELDDESALVIFAIREQFMQNREAETKDKAQRGQSQDHGVHRVYSLWDLVWPLWGRALRLPGRQICRPGPGVLLAGTCRQAAHQ